MITIEIVFATLDNQQLCTLTVEEGTKARELVIKALNSRLIVLEQHLEGASTIPIGIYGQIVDDDYQLVDGDRVEIYRPLQQDPKELRRKRALLKQAPGR